MKTTMIILTIAALTIAAFFIGCKEKDQPASNETSSMQGMTHQSTAENQAALVSIEQKTCPIMGQKINPNVSTEYNGKKVYFCCVGCIDEFKKDPGKYIPKLPQFNK